MTVSAPGGAAADDDDAHGLCHGGVCEGGAGVVGQALVWHMGTCPAVPGSVESYASELTPQVQFVKLNCNVKA